MKSRPLKFCIVLLVLLLGACSFRQPFKQRIEASGNPVSVTQPVQGFDQISLDGVGKLVIVQGETEALTILTDENFLPYFQAEVKGNTLALGLSKAARGVNLGGPDARGVDLVTYELVVKDLRALEIAGAALVEMPALETDQLTIHLEGVSELEIQSLDADQLSLQIEGTGSLIISGKVREQQIVQEGTCNYYAAELESEETTLELAGTGDVTVLATETLDVELSGLGNVVYYGNPQVTQNVSGMGRLISAGH